MGFLFRKRDDHRFPEVIGDVDPSLPVDEQAQRLTTMMLNQLEQVTFGGVEIIYRPHSDDDQARIASILVSLLISSGINVELRAVKDEPLRLSIWTA